MRGQATLHYFDPHAGVVELVDALRSGRSGRKPVWVRVPPSALISWTGVQDDRQTALEGRPPDPEAALCLFLSTDRAVHLSVPSDAPVDLLRPPVDPARQALHPREPRPQEEFARREIVTICHHGMRSLSARELLKGAGFGRVRSLAGGIDAWAEEVDGTVGRY